MILSCQEKQHGQRYFHRYWKVLKSVCVRGGDQTETDRLAFLRNEYLHACNANLDHNYTLIYYWVIMKR